MAGPYPFKSEMELRNGDGIGLYPRLAPPPYCYVQPNPYPAPPQNPQSISSQPTLDVQPGPSKCNPKIPFKYSRLLGHVMRFMIAPAIMIFVVSIIVSILATRYPEIHIICRKPSVGPWIGALGMVTSAMGMYSFRGENRRSALRIFFTFAVVTAIANGVLVLVAGECVVHASHELRILSDLAHHYGGPLTFGKATKITIALLVMEGILAFTAVIQMISAIVASVVICGFWWNSNTSTVMVIYIQPEMGPNIRRVAPAPQNQMYFVATQIGPGAPKYGYGYVY